MIDDSEITEFLPQFNLDDHFISRPTFSTIKIKNKSMYYWLNSVLHENITQHKKNINILNNLGVNITSHVVFIYNLMRNLESILNTLDTRNMTKWLIPLTPKKIELATVQNINIINLNKTICTAKNPNETEIPIVGETLHNIIPVTKHKNALIIGKALEMCPFKVYYPTDLEAYPVQRAVLYNLLLKKGVVMESDDIIATKANEFLTTLPQSINIKLFQEITNALNITDNTRESLIWMSFVRSYNSISKITNQKIYEKAITQFEDSIINVLTTTYKITINTDPNYITEMFCDRVKYCDTSIITSHTILKVLSNYENFYNDKITPIEKLELCPIQVEFIIHLFSFYKYKHLTIQDGKIICEDIPIEQDPELKSMKYFKDIKQLINFDGDYEVFKSTIELFSFEYTDIIPYINALYENRGFKCSVIIGELANYHLNTKLDTRSMYNLLSKLTLGQQNTLDENFPCRTEHGVVPTNKIITTLLESYIRKVTYDLEYDSIKNTLGIIENKITMVDKLVVASSTNFNCIPLIKYYVNNIDGRESVLILLLFSSAPNSLKNLIYKHLLITNTDEMYPIQHNKVPDYYINVILKTPITLETVLLSETSKNNCLGLLDYYKNTKLDDVLNILNSKVKEYET